MWFYRSDLKVSFNRELDKSKASNFSVKIFFFPFPILNFPVTLKYLVNRCLAKHRFLGKDCFGVCAVFVTFVKSMHLVTESEKLSRYCSFNYLLHSTPKIKPTDNVGKQGATYIQYYK